MSGKKVTDVEFFIKAQREKNISRWVIHRCSMCNYGCAFIFRGNSVFYDAGCDCTYGSDLQEMMWEDVFDHYNAQKNSKIIEEYNEFWGLNEVEKIHADIIGSYRALLILVKGMGDLRLSLPNPPKKPDNTIRIRKFLDLRIILEGHYKHFERIAEEIQYMIKTIECNEEDI